MRVVIAISIFFAIFNFLLLNNKPIIGEDEDTYLLLAQSISAGSGYRDIQYKDSPLHKKFSFLLPLLLVPVVRFAPQSFILPKLLVCLFGIFSLLALYLLYKKIFSFSRKQSILLVTLTGFSPYILKFSHTVLTEIPYLFFSVLSLLFIHTLREAPFKKQITVIFFILLSYFTRTIGLSLLFAFLMYGYSGKKWKNSVLFLTLFFSFLILANWIVTGSIGIGGVYLRQFLSNPYNYRSITIADFFGRIVQNIYALAFYAFPDILLGVKLTTRNVFAFFLSVAVFVGFLNSIVKKKTIADFYFLFFIAVLVVWPWTKVSGTRFIVPILPLVSGYFFLGLDEMSSFFRFKRLWENKFLTAAILIFVAVNAWQTYGIFSRFAVDSKRNGFLEISRWIENNVSPQSLLLGTAEAPLYFFARRKVAHFSPMLSNKEKIIGLIEKERPDYIVVDPVFVVNRKILKTTVEEMPGKFRCIKKFSGGAVYRVCHNFEK